MDTVVFPLVLATLAALAPGRLAVDIDSLFDIQIHLQIEPAIASKVRLPEVQDEVEKIWRPYGVHVVWTGAKSSDDSFPLTVVLGWHIDSRVHDDPTVLGRAFIGRSLLPTRPIRVSFHATEQTLALRPRAWTSIAGHIYEQELARALGRVLAHEVGHVLLALHAHDRVGLMREVFTPDELARPDRSPFVLTANDVGRLRSSIEHLRRP